MFDHGHPAVHQQEQGVAPIPLTHDRFTGTEADPAAGGNHLALLLAGEHIEYLVAAEAGQRRGLGGLALLLRIRRRRGGPQLAHRKRNGPAVAVHRIPDLLEQLAAQFDRPRLHTLGMPQLQFVDDGAVAKLLDPHKRLGIAEHQRVIPQQRQQHGPHLTGRNCIIETNLKAVAAVAIGHLVDDHVIGDLAIWNHQAGALNGAQAGVPPADTFHHALLAAQIDQITDREVIAQLQLQPGDQVLEQPLGGKTDHGGEHGGGGDQPEQLDLEDLAHHHHGDQAAEAQHQQLHQQLRRPSPPAQAAGDLQGQPQHQPHGGETQQQQLRQIQPAMGHRSQQRSRLGADHHPAGQGDQHQKGGGQDQAPPPAELGHGHEGDGCQQGEQEALQQLHRSVANGGSPSSPESSSPEPLRRWGYADGVAPVG